MRPRLPAAVLTTALLATSAAAAPAPAAAAPAAPVAAAPAGAGAVRPAFTLVARYGFDAGMLRDDTGRGHTLRPVAAAGGTVRPVVHGAGRAAAFPAYCCARVSLQARAAADLNPGARPLRWGAAVLLSRPGGGQNVLQKGYSASTSQYKLQIDGAAGRPSCVLVGAGQSRIRIARAGVSVADGRWHTLECRRQATVLAVLVDGVLRGRTTVPATLAVASRSPLSIGGKGAYRDNDQFRGVLDDVWVRTAR